MMMMMIIGGGGGDVDIDIDVHSTITCALPFFLLVSCAV